MKIIIFLTIFALSLNIKAEEELKCNHLTLENFNQELHSSPYAFLFFYDPKCSHSIKYFPFWNQLAAKYENVNKLTVACINCKKQRKICDALQVFGFPTINFYEKGELFEEYSYDRNYEQLSAYAECWSDPSREEECLKMVDEWDREYEEKQKAKAARKLLAARKIV